LFEKGLDMSTLFTKCLVVTAALLISSLQCPVACAQDDKAGWVAEDANNKWRLRVPEGWYGGGYYQITDRVSAMEKKGEGDTLPAQILRGLSRDARDLDAILLHLEMSADDSHGDGSFLKIRTTPAVSGASGFPAITQLTPEVWIKLGQRLLASTPGARDVQLIRHQEDIVIRGNQVATAGFKIVKDTGSDRYQGMIIIYRFPGVTTFLLDAPWHIAGLRLEEMWTMARSIRFQE
jgi:hypothetical protein